MSRTPSEKTQLANSRRRIKALEENVQTLSTQFLAYRVRATQAEQSAAEWKARFDKLLEFRKLTESETK